MHVRTKSPQHQIAVARLLVDRARDPKARAAAVRQYAELVALRAPGVSVRAYADGREARA